ncbi:SafA/ExsA family spore coat assembly protein [Moorella sp. Hama-1]|uniref:SafA/ExsA family spore coat assembly protein n=1 Tax=Moorella sp. Hama-1 TaxID=2138101 RepID=UPI000D65C1BD|nr:SafA/ExsA family spore coat assembly protein [Moorella sp. Hama-1]MDN5361874.1 hypothetical protein [Moorella sp. (in: firmicutes)]BCV21414.1 hypothetical protein hamaS1_14830 [Moorella sp. Hama-1]
MSDVEKKVEATSVSEAEAKHMQPACPNGFLYTVKSGDTMYFIAQRFGVHLNDLIAANPQIPDPNLIYPGQVICIPVKPSPGPCPGGFLYAVQSGDTMYFIAQRFGVSLEALIAANPQVTNPNLIYPGQVLCVPKTAPPPPPVPCPGGFHYTVQPGDTMYTIAQKFNVSLAALMAANPQVKDPSLIYPGQVICIPN